MSRTFLSNDQVICYSSNDQVICYSIFAGGRYWRSNQILRQGWCPRVQDLMSQIILSCVNTTLNEPTTSFNVNNACQKL